MYSFDPPAADIVADSSASCAAIADWSVFVKRQDLQLDVGAINQQEPDVDPGTGVGWWTGAVRQTIYEHM